MQYKGQLAPLGPEIVKVALSRQSNADVGEYIRKQFVNGMRQGENLCFDLDTTTPNFADFDVDGTFKADVFFNWEEMNKEAEYMKYVREDENHGIGGINPGHGYCRSDAFAMIIRSGLENEEEMNNLIGQIPLFNSMFHHVIIE